MPSTRIPRNDSNLSDIPQVVAEHMGRTAERLDALAVSVDKLAKRDAEFDMSLREMSERLTKALGDMTSSFKEALYDQGSKSTESMNSLRERYTTEISTLRASAVKREDLAWVKAFITAIVAAAVGGSATVWLTMVFHR
jgi:hypothetical protein